MLILGIETSCDETAAAVVENGEKVLSNVIASSIDLHQETGGVVPEVAARDAARKIITVVDKALTDANLTWEQIDAIAVTNGPGLPGSLMVGIETARALAFLYQKPIIPVHHIIGHIYSNVLERGLPVFPSLVLTVSGGHNNLVLWRDKLDFELLGETLDDSAGEAFDKVAKMLDLGFPGGPEIARLAEKVNKKAFDFPRPMMQSGDFNFSYSGLKTAVLYEIRKHEKLNEQMKADIAASFQEAITDSLLFKLKKAVEKYQPQEIYLAGGVSANKDLQAKIADFAERQGLDFFVPVKLVYSTDNAAMIASAGYFILQSSDRDFNIADVALNIAPLRAYL